MAQEEIATMTCAVLANCTRFSPGVCCKRQLEGCLKVQAHCHRPGRTYRSIPLVECE
jgi:hypothetical protein